MSWTRAYPEVFGAERLGQELVQVPWRRVGACVDEQPAATVFVEQLATASAGRDGFGVARDD
jgi:hypothetical protein